MTAITNFDITTKAINGTGLFDELMEAVSLRLQSEFDKSRITGSDYSKVYLNSITAVLEQSTKFVLSKEEAGFRADLVKEQITKAKNDILLQNEQIALLSAQVINEGKRGLILDGDLVAQSDRHDQSIKETALITAKIVTESKQQVILDNQVLSIQQDVSLSEQQELNLSQENARIAAQTTQIAAETLRINADKLLVDNRSALITQDILKSEAEVLTLATNRTKITADTALVTQQRLNAISQNVVLTRQSNKILAEQDLLNQKLITEKAQTEASASSDGILGAQKALYSAQTSGFARDAEQKAAKLLIDTWSVRQSTDGATTAGTGLTDSDILDMVTVLKTGVNA